MKKIAIIAAIYENGESNFLQHNFRTITNHGYGEVFCIR